MHDAAATLPGTILLLPLASALAILLLHGLLKNVAHFISCAVAVIIFVLALKLLGAPDDAKATLFPVFQIGTLNAEISFVIDAQSRGMMFVVTFIGMLVHLYSIGYMHDDKGRARYFGALSLFMFSMTGIVLADNFFMMFVFWELVGFSSYLLIGHWFEKPEAADAAKKAFITNRVGDFGFMAGILILFGMCGTVRFEDMAEKIHYFQLHAPGMLTLAALGIFLGAVGKSAQVPLHVWLPDAMEGPTPVSALIHAATMVAAGVYMLVRSHFLISASVDAQTVIAWIGGITAIMAALIGTQQNDIKKVLAYSTLSQLGYMVMAVGLTPAEMQPLSHGSPAMFHLYTHAGFKALLFLGSGAVIYACHHEQDIWKMGGLQQKMPVTFWTFVIGTAALMGVPLTSGFFSKEAILGLALEHNKALFAIGVTTAALTAYYMTRLVIVAFTGKARDEGADHAHEAPMIMILPLAVLAVPSIFAAYGIFAEHLDALTPEAEHGSGHYVVMACSLVALFVGAGLGFKLYWGRTTDPVNIPLLRNKFYFDEFYAGLVKYGQDRVAWIVNALQRAFADGIIAHLPAALARGLGSWFRRLQTGSLQAYTLLFGLGLVAAIYFAVFLAAKH